MLCDVDKRHTMPTITSTRGEDTDSEPVAGPSKAREWLLPPESVSARCAEETLQPYEEVLGFHAGRWERDMNAVVDDATVVEWDNVLRELMTDPLNDDDYRAWIDGGAGERQARTSSRSGTQSDYCISTPESSSAPTSPVSTSPSFAFSTAGLTRDDEGFYSDITTTNTPDSSVVAGFSPRPCESLAACSDSNAPSRQTAKKWGRDAFADGWMRDEACALTSKHNDNTHNDSVASELGCGTISSVDRYAYPRKYEEAWARIPSPLGPGGRSNAKAKQHTLLSAPAPFSNTAPICPSSSSTTSRQAVRPHISETAQAAWLNVYRVNLESFKSHPPTSSVAITSTRSPSVSAAPIPIVTLTKRTRTKRPPPIIQQQHQHQINPSPMMGMSMQIPMGMAPPNGWYATSPVYPRQPQW